MESIMDSLAVYAWPINRIMGRGFIFLLLCWGLSACQDQDGGHDHHDDHGHEHGEHDEHEGHGDHIELNQAQRGLMDLVIGMPQARVVAGDLEISGRLEVAPQNEAAITSMIGATIKEIKVIEGDEVKKGQVLAYMHHPNLIELQTKYQEAYHAYLLAYKKWKREKSLYEEQAASGKQFEQSTYEYNNAKSHKEGLAARLSLIGIDPTKLEGGKIMDRVPIKSPLSGFVLKVKVKTGQFVQADRTLFEVFNREHMHADFMVFEKDIHRVKEGQQILFTTSSLPGKEFYCEVYSAGKAFEEDPKAVHVHADIKNKSNELLPGMYVKGSIVSDEKAQQTLPREAVVLEDDQYYAFALKDSSSVWKFETVKIKVLNQGQQYFTVVLPEEKVLGYALTEAYTLLSEWKKGEGGHGHSH